MSAALRTVHCHDNDTTVGRTAQVSEAGLFFPDADSGSLHPYFFLFFSVIPLQTLIMSSVLVPHCVDTGLPERVEVHVVVGDALGDVFRGTFCARSCATTGS